MGIRLLSESVWSRIAAGEVVERPASAVKEMIENSLDAGARRVRVRLWDGGRVRIVVEDDGCGIAFDDLPLALTSHATSKIGGIEDLEAIHTLGYRGEALASLAAVARVEIRSRPAEEPDGGVIRAREGRVSDHTRSNCPPGTRVQVDSLFENLPARRKFLKSASGELRRAAGLLREYAICRPEVAFSLENDGRPIFSTDGGGDRRRAIERLWGAEPPISAVSAAAGHVRLECWWQPRGSGSEGRSEVSAFVNGRSVTDPLVKGAVSAASRGLAGGWALFFSIDPALIDVNIHPAKAEIRFRRPGEVFDAVKEAAAKLGGPAPLLRGAASPGGWDFKPGPGLDENLPEETRSGPGTEGGDPAEGPGTGLSEAKDFDSAPRRFGGSAPASSRAFSFRSASAPGGLFSRVGRGPENEVSADEVPTDEVPRDEVLANEALESETPGGGDAIYLGQLTSGYLVFDTPAGAAIVDPHAAHERVAFERVLAAAEGGVRSQPLLMPVPLPPTLQLEALERREALESVGFAYESAD
ncbi:MAG: DNA mismatch repair endonuclease MutL, partial [Synergistaceae bacterium]|nr:DNA mismatch repair endonuclease MutL [Synergistaceae bacterium]